MNHRLQMSLKESFPTCSWHFQTPHSCFLTSKIIALSFTYIFVAFLTASQPVSAAQRELKGKTSEKVDAVLVLDNSGSMLKTDPLRLRDQGATLFSQFLKADDRLAIVQFSQTATVVRALTPYDKNREDEVRQQVTNLGEPGTYTNIMAGVKLAKSILDESHREDAQQIIVLLSDGKMEPDPATGSPTVLSNELLNNFLPELKARGVKIYTVAFSDHADKELLASIALATEGVNWFTENAEKLHQSYADLFLAVKKPQMVPLTNKGFRVDDNIQEATFYISRDATQELELVSPDGTKVSFASKTADIKWFRSDKFDVVTIEKPLSGDWQISGFTPDEGFATILTNLKLTTDWPTTATAQTPTLLQARLYEGEKPVALPEVSGVTRYGYQIIPTDQVSAPIIKGTLTDDGKSGDKIASDGIFSALIEIENPGEYKLRAVAQSPTFTRNQQMPFRVKPPLVTLTVVSREPDSEDHSKDTHGSSGTDHGGGGHGAGHGGDDASDGSVHHENTGHDEKEHTDAAAHDSDAKGDKHTDSNHAKEVPTVTEEPEAEHKAEDEHKALENMEDYFIISLSDEAAQLKEIVVKCIAIAPNRKRYTLPLVRVDGGKGLPRYEFPAAALPQEGLFTVQAFFSGMAKGKREVKAASRIYKYQKVNKAGDEEIVKVVEVRKEPVKTTFPWEALITLVIINVVAAAASLMIAKKVKGTGKVEVPDFQMPAPLVASIKRLKDRIEVTEVDLNEPLFTDPNFEISAAMGAEAGTTDATAKDAPSEDTPPAEGEGEPPIEETEELKQ